MRWTIPAASLQAVAHLGDEIQQVREVNPVVETIRHCWGITPEVDSF